MRLLYVLCEVDKFFFTSFMLNTTLRMLKDGVRLRFYAAVSMKNVAFKKEKKRQPVSHTECHYHRSSRWISAVGYTER